MIDIALAEKFIEQVTQYTECNINIMDECGVIIASGDAARVGTFHDIAYYIITGNEDVVATSCEGDYPGVKPGINMVISVDGKREGVVGITGNPEEIKSVAMITKMAIEAMVKYEKQRGELYRRQNKKEQLVYFLTHESFGEATALRSLAKQLHYSEHVMRIPILCKLVNADTQLLLNLIKTGGRHNSEDISIILDETHILIFKTMCHMGGEVFSDYKFHIADYLSTVLRWLREQEKTATFYIGSFQTSFTQYCYAYHHCKWLESVAEPGAVSAFFYDYSGRYLRSVIPVSELQRMFQVYEKELDEAFKSNFLLVGGAIIAHNYNLVSAAKALFMHKNTLLYRFNKIKEVLNINPISSSGDRVFMESFYYYLMRER